MTVPRGSILGGFLALALFGIANAARCSDNLVFTALPPCRVIDTRVTGAGGKLVAGVPRSFLLRGPTINYQSPPAPFTNQGGSTTGCGIPDLGIDLGGDKQNIAQAVAINIVAVAPSGAGDLRAWPANHSVPLASVINYQAVSGLNLANGVVVPMCDEIAATPCASGDLTFQADVSGAFLVVDVVGYFHAGSTEFTENTALGHGALQSNTTGVFDTAIGLGALAANTTGNFNTAVGQGALATNTVGTANTASGAAALSSNVGGSNNTANGSFALELNTSGAQNTATGVSALRENTLGAYNTASGVFAMGLNSLGSFNTSSGAYSLSANTTGDRNTAVGQHALASNTTGHDNIALGSRAGYAIEIGVSNIDIGNEAPGDESNTIRIGTQGTGGGQQNRTFIAGIDGATSASGTAVLVNAAGQLGTTTSSRRFKEDIEDMGEASDGLMALRPVTFHYKPEYDDGSHVLQYGLIAEEVAGVFPGLVQYDADGQPRAVRYHFVNAMLLNEVQKQHRELAAQRRTIADLRQQLALMLERLAAVEKSGSSPARSPAPEVRRR